MPAGPVRILHLLGAMMPAGIETWLMHVLRNIDRDLFHMDFMVHTESKAAFDDEINRLGSRVIPCSSVSHPVAYALRARRIFDDRYDIVHSHLHDFSGFVLAVAASSGVRVRIAHSHLAPPRDEALSRRAYVAAMGWLIDRYATHGFACSKDAAASLFGDDWQRHARWSLLYYGIDLSRFSEEVDVTRIREELGVPVAATVIGNVARFEPQKNHSLFIDIAEAVVRRIPDAHFLLVGEGELRPAISAEIARRHLSDRFTFTGLRMDVPRVLRAMDTFVLPSHFEGLPVALVEAQATGLRVVYSDAISSECEVIPQLCRRVPLDETPQEWATKVATMLTDVRTPSPAECLRSLKGGTFDARTTTSTLENWYTRLSRPAVATKTGD